MTAFASDAETIEPTEATAEPSETEESETDPEAAPAAEEKSPDEEPEFTVTASGLTEDAALTARKLDGSDPDDADQLADLQKQLFGQRIYTV